MLTSDVPALILAPMDGLTDAPMRAVQGEIGAFTFSVAEFVRVSGSVLPKSVFYREIPELRAGARTATGLPVHVQLLGGHPGRMAGTAAVACKAGATAIDINFGCPAATVNNHDGGAALLKHPERIREIVRAVREAVPADIPVSAKLRLGWDSVDAIFENATMAAEGGADWLTVHARTREQAYRPPAHWRQVGLVRERVGIPVVANGDIWTIEEFRRCREVTGCAHFMLGRGGIANPALSHQVARELGLPHDARIAASDPTGTVPDWRPYLRRLIAHTPYFPGRSSRYLSHRVKQWLKIASLFGTGNGPAFEATKRAESVEEIFAILSCPHEPGGERR